MMCLLVDELLCWILHSRLKKLPGTASSGKIRDPRERDIQTAPLTTIHTPTLLGTYKPARRNGNIAVDMQNKNVLYFINLFRDFVRTTLGQFDESSTDIQAQTTSHSIVWTCNDICTIAVIHLAHDIGDQDH